MAIDHFSGKVMQRMLTQLRSTFARAVLARLVHRHSGGAARTRTLVPPVRGRRIADSLANGRPAVSGRRGRLPHGMAVGSEYRRIFS